MYLQIPIFAAEVAKKEWDNRRMFYPLWEEQFVYDVHQNRQ
jgi:hypothetical protein